MQQEPLPQLPDSVDFTSQFQTSFYQIFGEYIPYFLAAVVIIFAGYIFAKLLEKVVERFLKRIKLNAMLQRGGVIQAVERSGTHVNPTRVISNLIFWLVMFAVILLAADALGLRTLAIVVGTLVGYIPSVIAAVIIILVGIVLGGFVEGLIAASTGGVHGGRSLARIGRAGVVMLAIFMALQELGVNTEIVTTAFAILFGAIALAIALAFGLGNRDLAGEVTRDWYERYRRERAESMERERLEEAAMDAELSDDGPAGAARPGAADPLPGGPPIP